MQRKSVGILVVMLLIATVTVLPAANNSANSVLIENANKIKKPLILEPSSNKEDIRILYEEIYNLIYTNSNPSKEFSELLSYQEIKHIIREISDDETVDTIEALFSEDAVLIKMMKVFQYSNNIEKKRQDLQEFENETNNLIKSNFSSLMNVTFLPELDLTSDNITNLYNEFKSYMNDKSKLGSIMKNLYINPIIFLAVFAVSIIIWGFAYGAASCCIPDFLSIAIMFSFASILGVGSAMIMEGLFSSDNPFINQMIGLFCGVLQISYEQLLTITASLTCLVVFATYLYIWGSCPVNILKIPIKLFSGGLMLVGPPLLFSLFITSKLFPE